MKNLKKNKKSKIIDVKYISKMIIIFKIALSQKK